jgi:Holliday junction resolvase
MATGPEGKVKAAVRKILTRLGIYHFMPPGMGLGRSGISDIIGCYNGRFIAIECKAGKGKTTALQERELAAVKAAGGFTYIAREDNLEEMEGRLLLWTK